LLSLYHCHYISVYKSLHSMFSGFIDTLMYGFSSTGVTIYCYYTPTHRVGTILQSPAGVIIEFQAETGSRCAVNLERGDTRYKSPCQSHISNIKSFLPVEAEISVMKVWTDGQTRSLEGGGMSIWTRLYFIYTWLMFIYVFVYEYSYKYRPFYS
jgi:hypothetical protein